MIATVKDVRRRMIGFVLTLVVRICFSCCFSQPSTGLAIRSKRCLTARFAAFMPTPKASKVSIFALNTPVCYRNPAN